MALTDDLVQEDGGCGGSVQGVDLAGHGDVYDEIAVFPVQTLDALTLGADHQSD